MFMMFAQHLISSPFASDLTNVLLLVSCNRLALQSQLVAYFMNFGLSAVDYY
jgi:hypothetical protein